MADITLPLGGRTDRQLLFKDQGSGIYAPAVSLIGGVGTTFQSLTDRLPFTIANPAQPAMQVRANATQATNLWEFQATGGGVLLQVEATGRISTPAGTDLSLRAGTGNATLIGGGAVDGIRASQTEVQISIPVSPSASSLVGLRVRGLGGQTADLQQWQTSAPATLLSVAAGGHLTFAEAVNVIVGITTGTQFATVGGAAGQKMAWWGASPAVQPVMATGTGKTVDNLITMLQTMGLCRQS